MIFDLLVNLHVASAVIVDTQEIVKEHSHFYLEANMIRALFHGASDVPPVIGKTVRGILHRVSAPGYEVGSQGENGIPQGEIYCIFVVVLLLVVIR